MWGEIWMSVPRVKQVVATIKKYCRFPVFFLEAADVVTLESKGPEFWGDRGRERWHPRIPESENPRVRESGYHEVKRCAAY